LTEESATEQGEEKAPRENMDCEDDVDFHSDGTTDEEDGEGSPSLRSGGVGANQQQALCNVVQLASANKFQSIGRINVKIPSN
jgi:hypothetical protein